MDDAFEHEDQDEITKILRMQIDAIKKNPGLAREMLESHRHIAENMIDFGKIERDFVLMIHICLLKDMNMTNAVGAMIILHNAMRADGERLYYAEGSIIDKAVAFINWQYDTETYPKPVWYEV